MRDDDAALPGAKQNEQANQTSDDEEQRRLNYIRVKGYALYCCNRVRAAHEAFRRADDRLESTLTALLRRREERERALAELEDALQKAEWIARVVAQDDAKEIETVAMTIERAEEEAGI
jgi:hypothetical protein